MSGELRVPVAALPAVVALASGASMSGRIYVPAVASRHGGPTRPVEWINDGPAFFPFLPDEADRPVLLNKAAVLALTVPAWSDEPDPDEVVPAPQREVVVECGAATFRGRVALDLPAHQGRLLDVLNLAAGFLTVCDGGSHHLVNKRHVVRVVEAGGG